MNSKQNLIAGLVGIAMMIAMPIAAAAGDRDSHEYRNTEWQAPGGVIPVGHHYGWRNHANYNPGLVCDEDGDDCYPDVQCDEDGDDCHAAVQCDEDGDDCDPYPGYRGYESQHYGRVPAYNSYDYNPGYNGRYNAPYSHNGIYGDMSTLVPLLQQYFR